MIILGAISTLVSLFYYFKIPLNAYLKESISSDVRIANTAKAYLSMFLAFLLLLLLVFPSLIQQFL